MTGRQGGVGSAAEGADRYGGQPAGVRGGERLHRRMGCGDLKSVPEVRHGLRELLGRWGGREAADVAELLASELVTNALIHTDHGAVVTATVGTSTLRVEVRDFVEGFPEPPPALTAVGGPAAGAGICTGIGTGVGNASGAANVSGTGSTSDTGNASDTSTSTRTSTGTGTGFDEAEAMPDPDLLETHGRGLALVQSLADSWGVHTQRAGKVVWFELNALSA